MNDAVDRSLVISLSYGRALREHKNFYGESQQEKKKEAIYKYGEVVDSQVNRPHCCK